MRGDVESAQSERCHGVKKTRQLVRQVRLSLRQHVTEVLAACVHSCALMVISVACRCLSWLSSDLARGWFGGFGLIGVHG